MAFFNVHWATNTQRFVKKFNTKKKKKKKTLVLDIFGHNTFQIVGPRTQCNTTPFTCIKLNLHKLWIRLNTYKHSQVLMNARVK